MDSITDKRYFGLACIFLLAYLVVFARPLNVEQWQWADEGLYLKNAFAMVEHFGGPQWLGPLEAATLSKAPFYSVYLAANIGLGIPYRLSEFLMFCPLPFLFWIAVRPLGVAKWPVLYAGAVLLLFLPVVGAEFRLLRNSLFGAASLYCLISVCGLFIRGWIGAGGAWKWALIAGLAMGIAATTREEAMWMIVPALLTVMILLARCFQERRIAGIIFPIVVLAAGYMTAPTFFSTMNYQSYGVYAPSLRQHRYFKELYSVLVSLEPEQRIRYVPIVSETRERAYAVSPRFAEIRDYMDGPELDPIATHNGHMWLNGWPSDGTQREFFVSNFEFALATSIMMSGRETGSEILRYCRKTARELDRLAKEGKIDQGPKGISLMPPILVDDYPTILESALKSFVLLLTGKDMDRTTVFALNPDLKTSSDWHALLGTWPGSTSERPKATDILFNKVLVVYAKYFYALLIVAGIWVLWAKSRRGMQEFLPYLFLVGVSWSAVFAFNGILGILDTVGWRTLIWPKSYNSLGYFPFHFALLVTATVCISFFQQGKKAPASGVE